VQCDITTSVRRERERENSPEEERKRKREEREEERLHTGAAALHNGWHQLEALEAGGGGSMVSQEEHGGERHALLSSHCLSCTPFSCLLCSLSATATTWWLAYRLRLRAKSAAAGCAWNARWR